MFNSDMVLWCFTVTLFCGVLQWYCFVVFLQWSTVPNGCYIVLWCFTVILFCDVLQWYCFVMFYSDPRFLMGVILFCGFFSDIVFWCFTVILFCGVLQWIVLWCFTVIHGSWWVWYCSAVDTSLTDTQTSSYGPWGRWKVSSCVCCVYTTSSLHGAFCCMAFLYPCIACYKSKYAFINIKRMNYHVFFLEIGLYILNSYN